MEKVIQALQFVETYDWNNETYYKFNIWFEDGEQGIVSAKSENPRYKVGDTVQVENRGPDKKTGETKFGVKPLDSGNKSYGGKKSYGNKNYKKNDESYAIGQRIGNSITNAQSYISATGEDFTYENLLDKARIVYKVAVTMEKAIKGASSGNTTPSKATPKPAPKPAPKPLPPSDIPVYDEDDGDDVPF